MYLLNEKLFFPNVETANLDGVVALGGDLSVKRLVLAYQSGIFPWFNYGEPIVWYSPPMRMVLFSNHFKLSKSLNQILKKGIYTVTKNKSFKQVIKNCKEVSRLGQEGTWITDSMEKAYNELHLQGYAKSIEVWKGEKLVGGLYGIEIGSVFCGESMFSLESNTSKIAFETLVQHSDYKLIDCQVYNDHLASLGAIEIPRQVFLEILENR